METVQQLPDKIYELPKEEFETFDDVYKRYRIEKKREGFLNSYNEALIAKQGGHLFATNEVHELTKWLL